jgi:ATP-dependent protease HslVU (ClpYQ) peptidase subunit
VIHGGNGKAFPLPGNGNVVSREGFAACGKGGNYAAA